MLKEFPRKGAWVERAGRLGLIAETKVQVGDELVPIELNGEPAAIVHYVNPDGTTAEIAPKLPGDKAQTDGEVVLLAELVQAPWALIAPVVEARNGEPFSEERAALLGYL